MHKTNPDVIALAKLLGRTPSSVGMKLGNLARLDPEMAKRGIGGLDHGAGMEKEVEHVMKFGIVQKEVFATFDGIYS